MVYDPFKTDQLAKKVRARQEFLNLVVTRIIDLVRKNGRITKRDQGNSHTRVVSELRNFGNFTFETDLGQTDFGGNDIKIWHHPGKNFWQGGLDSAWDRGWTPVLSVYFQTEGNYLVSNFKETRDWQVALKSVLKNEDKIVALIKKAQDKSSKLVKNQQEKDKKTVELIKTAQNLGIISEKEMK